MDIKSIINRKWEGESFTNKRPKLKKVDRYSLVYQQGEPDLQDEDTDLFGTRTVGVLVLDCSKNMLRTTGKEEQDPAHRKRHWQE